MSQQNEGLKAFIAGEDLEPYRRVKLSTGSGDTVEYADQADSNGFIGITQHKASLGDHITIRLRTRGKTYKAEASEALVAGAALYAADDGKVADTAAGDQVATALEAASGDGVIVEIILM